jgi:NAD-dependent dihydropyrimidine dehydrogenase PreA subunit
MFRFLKRLLALVAIASLVSWLFGERGKLARPSSLQMMRKGGLRRFLNFDSVHGYVYGRWTNQYINILINHVTPRLGPGGRKWLSDHYHGKVLTHEQAQAIVNLDHDIPLTDLEQIIPYPVARSILLSAPLDIAVYECACRHARANPCQPTQVCMVVGEEFVDFIVEHNPQSSRRISQQEALQLLDEEHDRGHVHSAWFKDALLDRFYAICNCCKCCCGGIEAMTKYGMPSLVSSGYVAKVDEALCNGCGICVESCAFGALSLAGEGVLVEWETCMGCGVCVGQCPLDAASLERDERKGIPLDVTSLAAVS